jgi:GT2 family glycosyltransferase
MTRREDTTWAFLAERLWSLRVILSRRLRRSIYVGRFVAPVSDRLFRHHFVADLQLLNDTLAAHGLAQRYWLWGGVLLGFAREGAPLAHDRDADFALEPEDFARLLRVVPALRDAGFTPLRQFRNNEDTLTEVTFRRHGARFEFFLFRPRDGESIFFLYGWPPDHLVEAEARLPEQERVDFDFLNRRWRRSRDTERELSALYGDWRRREPDWDYLNDTRAIVARRPWTNSDTSWRHETDTLRPIRLVNVDVEEPWPDLVADEDHHDAWVTLRTSGVARAIVEVALGDDPRTAHEYLERAAATLVPRAPREPLDDAALPTMSVVVPTIASRLDELDGCLRSLEDVDYPGVDLLLVDNRRALPTPDPLATLMANHPRVHVVRAPRAGISAARNVGIAHARGDVVAFTDDDVRVERGWLRAIGERLAREANTDAISGLVLPGELDTPAQIYYERYFGGFGAPRTFEPVHLVADTRGSRWARAGHFLAFDDAGREVRRASLYGVGAYVAGANMAFRREALERIGGFNEDLGTGTPARGGEDLYAVITLLATGGRVTYEPAAAVYHRHRRSYGELVSQMDASGVGFSAMLCALVRSDPRHGARLISQAATALAQTLRRARASGVARASAATPPEFFWREVRGYLRGPAAYLASRRREP